ncbi:hypothetical protein SK128_016300, partial [Halocaridina rubra]
MAATSGGVEWSQMVKPILAASYGSVNKQDIPELVKAIVKSKEEILHHDDQYEPFYSAFCVLAADYLASNAHQVSVGGVSQAVSAARILLQFLAGRVGTPPTAVTTPVPLSSTSSPSVTTSTTPTTGPLSTPLTTTSATTATTVTPPSSATTTSSSTVSTPVTSGCTTSTTTTTAISAA